MHDFSVRTILIDLARTNGKKTALDKCAMLEQSLARFAGGDEVLKVIKDKTQATSMGSSMGLAMGRGSSGGGLPGTSSRRFFDVTLLQVLAEDI